VAELLLVTFAEVPLDDAAFASIQFPNVCDPNIPMAPDTTTPVASPEDGGWLVNPHRVMSRPEHAKAGLASASPV
jgi:hypothetical protein